MNGGAFSQGAIISAGAAAASMGLNELAKNSQGNGTTGVGEDADSKARAELMVAAKEYLNNLKYPSLTGLSQEDQMLAQVAGTLHKVSPAAEGVTFLEAVRGLGDASVSILRNNFNNNWKTTQGDNANLDIKSKVDWGLYPGDTFEEKLPNFYQKNYKK